MNRAEAKKMESKKNESKKQLSLDEEDINSPDFNPRDLSFKDEAQYWRSKFQKEVDREKEEEKKRIEEIRVKKEEAEEQAKLELYQIEIVKNTKPYYTFKDGRNGKRMEPLNIVYFGENIETGVGRYENESTPFWTPDGYGDFSVKGSTLYEGDFLNGDIHGTGQFDYQNGESLRGLNVNETKSSFVLKKQVSSRTTSLMELGLSSNQWRRIPLDEGGLL